MRNPNHPDCSFPLLVSSLVSIAILFCFVSYYKVPPLVDLLPHVAIGMIKGTLLQYYQYQPAFTYRLLDSIVRFWSLLYGITFVKVILATYITTLILIISTVYSFCILLGMSYWRAFYVIGILIGPLFLLLHTAMFLGGLIPYTLSVFMAALSAASLWTLDTEITAHNTMNRKTLIIFIIYSFLAIYSHMVGFLYLAIGWLIPAFRFLFIKDNRLKRSILYAAAALSVTLLFVSHAGHYVSTPPEWEGHANSSFSERVDWLLAGTPYQYHIDTQAIIPLHAAGILSVALSRQLLTLIPFLTEITLISIFIIKRKQSNNLIIFLIMALLLGFLITLIGPNRWGELGEPYARNWLFVCAVTLMGMAYLLHCIPKKIFIILSLISPFFIIFSCATLNDLYANFRKLPIESVTDDYSNRLLQASTLYREHHPEAKTKVLIIHYDDYTAFVNHVRSNWFYYRVVPFLMMNSPELIKNNIIIKNEWGTLEHLPVVWKNKGIKSSNIIDLHWDLKDNPIQLTLVDEPHD